MIDTDRIKERLPLLDYVERLGLTPKRVGSSHRCTCPIHSGDNPTAFAIKGDRWQCHTRSECGGGDVIDLIAKIEGLEIGAAIKLAAEYAGISNTPNTRPPARRPPPAPTPTPAPAPATTTATTTALHDWAITYLIGRGLNIDRCRAAGVASGVLNGSRCILFAYRQSPGGAVVGVRGRKVATDNTGKITAAGATGSGLFFVRYEPHARRRLWITEGEFNGVSIAHASTANIVSVGSQTITQWQLLALRARVAAHDETIVFFDRADYAHKTARALGARVRYVDSGEVDTNGEKSICGKMDANDLLRADLLEAFLLSRNIVTVK